MTTPTTYVLDERNRICSVSGIWDEFADENGGQKLSSSDVCGRTIWDFVAGDATRMWLDAIFQLTRLRETSLERSYRCDSPDVKRFMRMRVVPEQGRLLRIEHEILATEPRPVPVSIQYAANALDEIRRRCSICGRIHNGSWLEPQAEHVDASNRIMVIYTVCEDCKRLLPRP